MQVGGGGRAAAGQGRTGLCARQRRKDAGQARHGKEAGCKDAAQPEREGCRTRMGGSLGGQETQQQAASLQAGRQQGQLPVRQLLLRQPSQAAPLVVGSASALHKPRSALARYSSRQRPPAARAAHIRTGVGVICLPCIQLMTLVDEWVCGL
jgi:hypothetical protein